MDGLLEFVRVPLTFAHVDPTADLGIDWVFLGTDFLGGLFSLVALGRPATSDLTQPVLTVHLQPPSKLSI